MLPLAIACVDAECKESWSWFLSVLCEVLGGQKTIIGFSCLTNKRFELSNACF